MCARLTAVLVAVGTHSDVGTMSGSSVSASPLALLVLHPNGSLLIGSLFRGLFGTVRSEQAKGVERQAQLAESAAPLPLLFIHFLSTATTAAITTASCSAIFVGTFAGGGHEATEHPVAPQRRRR